MVLTLDLPDDIAQRLAAHVPAQDRESFLVRAVQRALPRMTDEELERISAEVEADERLREEMQAFDVCVADGMGENF